LHLPPAADGLLKLGWSTEAGSYDTEVQISNEGIGSARERFKLQNGAGLISPESSVAFAALESAAINPSEQQKQQQQPDIVWPLAHSRDIKLSLEVLRQDSAFVPSPSLGPDGSQIAAVLSSGAAPTPSALRSFRLFADQVAAWAA
jgi:hypothetical protein